MAVSESSFTVDSLQHYTNLDGVMIQQVYTTCHNNLGLHVLQNCHWCTTLWHTQLKFSSNQISAFTFIQNYVAENLYKNSEWYPTATHVWYLIPVYLVYGDSQHGRLGHYEPEGPVSHQAMPRIASALWVSTMHTLQLYHSSSSVNKITSRYNPHGCGTA